MRDLTVTAEMERRGTSDPVRSQQRSGRWAIAYVGVLIAFQIALFFFGGTATLRLPLRIGGYACSLALLVIHGQSPKTAPARWARFAIVLLVLEIMNPLGDAIASRIAQVCLYTSVLAPLIWVSKLQIDRRVFKTVVVFLWLFYTTSSFFGVLQVEFPGRFDGSLSANYDDRNMAAHTFALADGTTIIRPKGLTDNPGGASTAGAFTILLGMGIILTQPNLFIRAVAVVAMGVGLFCIYICQVRTNLLIVGFAFAVVVGILFRRGAIIKAQLFCAVGVGVALIGTSMAFVIGGQSTVDRFMSLLASDAGTVYQDNRGQFLQDLLTRDIFEFPAGAGLGHWGMMNTYFGTAQNNQWAEMQWQALVYDGGILLIALYLGIFGSALWLNWKLAVERRDSEMPDWAAIMFAYTLAAFAASFSFPIMSVQSGMEMCLLNACLFAASNSGAQGDRLTLKVGSRGPSRRLRRTISPILPA